MEMGLDVHVTQLKEFFKINLQNISNLTACNFNSGDSFM